MFADDTKIWCPIKTAADSITLHCSRTLFHFAVGQKNGSLGSMQTSAKSCTLDTLPTEYYMMEGTRKTILESVQEETDLGVVVRSDLKSTSQCNRAAAAAARRIIAMVRRNFKKLDVEAFLLIYKTYIRPRLEFCIQSWSPHLTKDIETLERVQTRGQPPQD